MENIDHEETPMEMEENKEEIQNKEENCGEEMMQGLLIIYFETYL